MVFPFLIAHDLDEQGLAIDRVTANHFSESRCLGFLAGVCAWVGCTPQLALASMLLVSSGGFDEALVGWRGARSQQSEQ